MEETEAVRVRKLLLEVESEEQEDNTEGGASESDGWPHSEAESEHNTESEEDADSVDEDISEIEDNSTDFYLGKDGKTRWRKVPPPANTRCRSHNIIRCRLPSVKGNAKNCKSPQECFELFFTADIWKIILENTNKFIDSVSDNYSEHNKYKVKHTNMSEMKAVIGLLFMAGVFRSNRQNLDDLWVADGTGMDIFRTTMSLQRFRFILQCLRFDDKSTRAERSKIDKLAPIRDVFEHFVANCRNNYTVGEIVTIDEKLEGFRGKCPFRQYIPSKPGKYGIKIFALADSRTFYSSNLEVYTGKQPEGPYNMNNSADAVVERLISRISGSGTNVTVDNWFNSVPPATRLLKDHNLTLLGTVRKNKKELPPEFVQTKNRQIHSSLFGFNGDITLVSHVPKKGKVVLLLSTMHHDDKIDESTGEQKKPDMITSYNTFKGGVNTVDHMCATYDVSRNSRRWPLTVFFSLLNIAGINSQVIYLANTQTDIRRRLFLKTLALGLLAEHREQRATSTSLPRELQMKLKRQATSIQGEHKEEKRRREGKGRCEVCPRTRDRKTKYVCKKC